MFHSGQLVPLGNDLAIRNEENGNIMSPSVAAA